MFGLTLVTPSTSEPVSLAEVKQHCRIEEAVDDGLLAGYVLAARALLEQQCNLALSAQTWDLTLDRFPPFTALDQNAWGNRADTWPRSYMSYASSVILLPRGPVQSITSISYTDANGAAQTLPANQYQLDTSRTPARLAPAFGTYWPTSRYQYSSVVVRFVAGYTQLPEPLRQALLLIVGHWYENREAVTASSPAPTMLPLAVDALIEPYRLRWLA